MTDTGSTVILSSQAPVELCPCASEVGTFLSQYAAWLLGCGATCIRLKKNVNRIARTYGYHADMTILPRHIHLTVTPDDNSSSSFTLISSIPASGISFDMNSRLSSLSWEIADNHTALPDAISKFKSIISTQSGNPWVILLLASVANASFCRLFGGDTIAMATVFVATMAGFYLKQIMVAKHVSPKLIFIICAFVSSVLGATDALFHIGNTPDIAVATSVLYLVPGIPLLNSFSDMLDGHYICAFSRFMDAVLLTACLSVGLCCGMALMNIGMF